MTINAFYLSEQLANFDLVHSCEGKKELSCVFYEKKSVTYQKQKEYLYVLRLKNIFFIIFSLISLTSLYLSIFFFRINKYEQFLSNHFNNRITSGLYISSQNRKRKSSTPTFHTYCQHLREQINIQEVESSCFKRDSFMLKKIFIFLIVYYSTT